MDPDAAAEDAWLIEKARAGDLQAFEVLVHRHRDRIYRVALRTLGSPEDAEDVTQDVVIQLWTGLGAFSGRSSFTTWLHRIVLNRCLNRRRGARRTGPLSESDESRHPDAAVTADQVQCRAQLATATRAIAALAPDLRSAFVLCQLEGMSYRGAASVDGVSEAAIRGRLARARAGLMDAMREWT